MRNFISQEKKKKDAIELSRLSEQLLSKLEESAFFCSAKIVLMYYSLKDEVQTHEFVDKWSKTKTILLPTVKGTDLELCIYSGKKNLTTGAFHIDEPTGKTFTNYAAIDLAVIPGVAFDKEGNRLGRGKGYYDRLLPLIKAPKIGICFPFQFVEKVPSESFDVKMDRIITI